MSLSSPCRSAQVRKTINALAAASLMVLSSCTYSTGVGSGDLGAPPDAVPFADDEAEPPIASTVPETVAPAPTTTAVATTTTLKPQSCVGDDFSINYPEAWYVGAPDSDPGECLWLSRGSLATISSDSFVPEIELKLAPHYGDALKATADFQRNSTALSDSYATNFNSFPATVFDLFADGTGDVEVETRTRVVVIDLGDGALIGTATEATTGDPGNFEETKKVLNQVLTSLYPVR